jgi:type I restriction enzyme M protein
LANGSLSSQQSGEGDIRRAIIEADLVDCIVSLPGQLFFTTQIPVCLWFLTRDKSNGLVRDLKLRDRRRQTLFIDARKLGTMETRTLRTLTDTDVAKIADAYHAWREPGGDYANEPGFLQIGDDGGDCRASLCADAGPLRGHCGGRRGRRAV